MPGPDPHYMDRTGNGWISTYCRYFETGKEANRKKRVAMIGERLARHGWVCRCCSDPIPIRRRADALYCRESCGKRAARASKRHSWVSLSSWDIHFFGLERLKRAYKIRHLMGIFWGN